MEALASIFYYGCCLYRVKAYKEIAPNLSIGVGADGKVLNGSISAGVTGSVKEEYSPQGDCLRTATNIVGGVKSTCNVEAANRKAGMITTGCTK